MNNEPTLALPTKSVAMARSYLGTLGTACLLLAFCAACAEEAGNATVDPGDDDAADDDVAEPAPEDDDSAGPAPEDDDSAGPAPEDDDSAEPAPEDDDSADDDSAGPAPEDDDAATSDDDSMLDAGDSPLASASVDLGAAGDFAILAKSAISTVPTSDIVGDIGLSPAAATFITGFSLIADPTNVFSTSPQLTGRAYAADYEPPTPFNLTTAVGDMELAFTDAAGRAPDFIEIGAGDVGGMTLEAGVYKWGTGLTIPADITLSGGASDVWIFQIAEDLAMSSATSVVLTGGARPENVFWQVSGLVDLGTTAHCEGVVLTQTSVTLRTGSSINGRLLAQTAVTIDAARVLAPE